MNYDDDDDGDADMQYSMYSSSTYDEASRIAEARARSEANRQRALFNRAMSQARADPYDMNMMQNMLPQEDEFDSEYASSSAYADTARMADAAIAARVEANRQRALFNRAMAQGRDDIRSGRAYRPRRTFDTSSNEPGDRLPR